jgi:hypothetical protein
MEARRRMEGAGEERGRERGAGAHRCIFAKLKIISILRGEDFAADFFQNFRS